MGIYNDAIKLSELDIMLIGYVIYDELSTCLFKSQIIDALSRLNNMFILYMYKYIHQICISANREGYLTTIKKQRN